ncbi:MAG: sigma-70 family RNA polymerase sigma factor [Planctomycetes bacterium]|nr:sigma-70 family RNA polymerase sigma factor [Planctomycetota bacterium]
MSGTDTTSWRVIRGAADGDPELRDQYARLYGPVMEAYFSARWRGTPLVGDVADSVQEAFVECFRPDGALRCVDPARPGGFRAYLFGVLRNVARRVEQRRIRDGQLGARAAIAFERSGSGESASVAFDRAWATALMQEAAQRQAERAIDAAAQRRVELLRLRFHEGLPIRDIAVRWQIPPDVLHHDYARARREFEAALREVVAAHHPGSPAEVDETLREVVRALSG